MTINYFSLIWSFILDGCPYLWRSYLVEIFTWVLCIPLYFSLHAWVNPVIPDCSPLLSQLNLLYYFLANSPILPSTEPTFWRWRKYNSEMKPFLSTLTYSSDYICSTHTRKWNILKYIVKAELIRLFILIQTPATKYWNKWHSSFL